MGMIQFIFLEAAPAKSFGDTMATAGLNTLMGISIVFLALILISFIISLFKYINRMENRKKRSEEEDIQKAAPVEVVEAEPEYVEENLVDDGELVAVITAAIYAYEAEQEEYAFVPADGLVVRSIRRCQRI